MKKYFWFETSFFAIAFSLIMELPANTQSGNMSDITGPMVPNENVEIDFQDSLDDAENNFGGTQEGFEDSLDGGENNLEGPEGEFPGPEGEFPGPGGEFPGPEGEFPGPRR